MATRNLSKLDPTPLRFDGAGGVGINVWDYGGQGRAVMLNHCTGTHARIWDPLAAELTERFHVYAMDTRGHGDSDKPEDPDAYAWDPAAEDLVAVLEALNEPLPLYAVGHSAGAAHICHTALARPGMVSKAVLIDPIIGPAAVFDNENPLAVRALRRKNRFESLDAARERYGSKPPMNAWDPPTFEAYLAHAFYEKPDGSVELKCPGHIESATYARGGASKVFERLGEIEIEALLVTADGSDVRPMTELQKERLRGAELHVMEGAGHFIPQEKPRETLALILDWFGEDR